MAEQQQNGESLRYYNNILFLCRYGNVYRENKIRII